jgi:hypothetical protein
MARLGKGQLAAGVARRKDQASNSVQRRLELFERLIKSPSLSDELKSIAMHFKSHVAICKWIAPELEIAPVSFNTLRKYVDNLFLGGWAAFETKRQGLMALLEGDYDLGRAFALKRKLNAQVEEQHKLLWAIGTQAAAYQDCLERLGKLAKRSTEAERQLRAHTTQFPPSTPRLRLVRPGD